MVSPITNSKAKKLRMPHTFVIILCMVLFAAVLTYILPAGEFDRVEDVNSGNTVVVQDSYHHVEQNPISLFNLPLAVVQGLVSASDTVFLSLLLVVFSKLSILQEQLKQSLEESEKPL